MADGAAGLGSSVVFSTLRELQRSAEAFAVLVAAQDAGLPRLLTSPTTSEALRARLGVPLSRIDAVLEFLESYGVVQRRDDLWILSSGWEPLVSGRTPWDPSAFLTMGGVRLHHIERCLDQSADYWTLGTTDRLAVATGISPNPEHAAQMLRADIGSLEGVVDSLDSGGRVLELGCGVGSRITGLMLAFPAATAVGVELASDLAEAGCKRAAQLGVGDRVKFVVGDATTYEPDGTFDLVGWSQFFFPEPSRIPTLKTARRALRKGGWITAPALWDGTVLEPGSEANQSLASNRLMLDLWGAPLKAAHEVAGEMAGVGFTEVRVQPSVGRWHVHGRQP